MRYLIGRVLVLFFGIAATQVVTAADTIKIAHIDPLSGPFALQGQSGSRHIQQAIDEINARGGVLGGTRLEMVELDNKSSPQESLVALKQAVDQGIRFVTQGNGSHVGHALTEAVLKHNRRNARQRSALSESRRDRPGVDQREMQLLAFPLRCQRRHEGRCADDGDRKAERGQEALSHQSGLCLRPGDQPHRQGDDGEEAPRRARSSATNFIRPAR